MGSTSASTAGFETEAYKLMISDISKTTLAPPGPDQSDSDEPCFLYNYSVDTLLGRGATKSNSSSASAAGPPKELTLKIRLVWIQGHIKSSNYENGDRALLINDGSGVEALVFNSENVPGGDHSNLVKGTYVGILGQILRAGPPPELPNIKAVKIMHLQDKPNLDSLWTEEVKDLKAFLIGLIQPTS